MPSDLTQITDGMLDFRCLLFTLAVIDKKKQQDPKLPVYEAELQATIDEMKRRGRG